jgi:hypothetical protein
MITHHQNLENKIHALKVKAPPTPNQTIMSATLMVNIGQSGF